MKNAILADLRMGIWNLGLTMQCTRLAVTGSLVASATGEMGWMGLRIYLVHGLMEDWAGLILS